MKNSILTKIALVVLTLSMAPASQAIIGGKLVGSDDPIARSTVGIILQTAQGQAICTGSLVSATQVLTAGHCAMGATRIFIVFGTDVAAAANDVGKIREVTGRQVDPSYIKAANGLASSDHSDVAVLSFRGGVPAGFAPIRLMNRELAKSVMKDEARIVLAGFGASDYYASGGSGVLRKINTKIDKFYNSGRSVKVGTSDHGACHGDSGGPAIINVGGQNYVFAVTSRSTAVGNDGTCSGRAIYSLIY
jgi:secreted trypsin-like serine protease